MTGQAELVRRIVQEVLARLDQHAAPTRPEPQENLPSDQVRWQQPVLTAQGVEELPEGVRELVLPSRCVVTPWAQELARQRGLRLHRAPLSEQAAEKPPLLVLAVPGPAAPLTQGLGLSVPWKPLPSLGLDQGVQELAQAVRLGGHRALIWAQQPLVATCAANRHPPLRAVTGTQPWQLRQDAAQVAANCLVLQPRTLAPAAAKALIRWFATRPLEPVPEPLKG